MNKLFLLLTLLLFNFLTSHSSALASPARFWQVQSIDTMKYSRDVARQYSKDYGYDSVIDAQVKVISETGATHVAIATPYDSEFVPFLDRWVKTARKYKLSVWFRGNLSGWENWFGYGDITPSEHTDKIIEFITQNQQLFADGDVFTSCPECENGGEGDPRQTGKAKEYRQFLISEHTQVKKAFNSLNKNVVTNFYSMNGDVAKLIMDRETTTALGGIVTIDHYVKNPEKLISDIKDLASKSGGLIVLGEWGAPIPDIHGKMTEKQQADWLQTALQLLSKEPSVIGLNYWTNQGSSTELWDSPQKPKEALSVLTSFYSPKSVEITIKNTTGKPLFASINYLGRGFTTDKKGKVNLPWPGYSSALSINSTGYKSLTTDLELKDLTLNLDPEQKNWWYNLRLLTYRFFKSIIPINKEISCSSFNPAKLLAKWGSLPQLKFYEKIIFDSLCLCIFESFCCINSISR